MSVKIDLPPDIEANLAAQAASLGISLDEHLRHVLEERARARRRQADDARGARDLLARFGQGPAGHQAAFGRGDQPREHLRRARVSVLVDTNVLLRRTQPSHPSHAVAVESMARLLASGEPVHYTLQNIAEFWNVATRPAERNGLGFSAAASLAEVEKIEAALELCRIRRRCTTNGSAWWSGTA